MAINIPDDIFNVYNEGVTEMLRVFGVNCKFIYPPEQVECSNCVTSGIGGMNTSVYIEGGPAPFKNGRCPLCNSEGYKEIEVSETIKMRVYWTEKEWKKIGHNAVQVPDGGIMTLCELHRYPKIKAVDMIEVCTAQTGYEHWRYMLSGEPFPHGFQKNKWMMAIWSRNG